MRFEFSPRSAVSAIAFGAFLLASPLSAFAQDPTPGQLAAARQVVLASGVTRTFDSIVPDYMAQVTRTLTQTRPELVQQVQETLKALQPEFEAKKEELIATAAKIYASDLSEQELNQIATFFKSPAGQKYVNSQPDMLNKLVAVMQAWSRNLSVEMVTRVREELKKKNIDL